MSASAKLRKLAAAAFALAGESVPLGFDPALISSTVSKLPNGITAELRSLFANDWPSDFFLGAIEIIGSDRINAEHEELYPGLAVIPHGFICVGSDGTGTMYSHCTADDCIYLLPNENFSDDGLHSDSWDELEMTPENIKSVAISSWDSFEALFDWVITELETLRQQQENDA